MIGVGDHGVELKIKKEVGETCALLRERSELWPGKTDIFGFEDCLLNWPATKEQQQGGLCS